MIKITENLYIPEEELKFTASRSSGPGGQYVNKVNTRMTLWFDVGASPSLTENQKIKIRNRLSTRISKTGVLRVVAQSSRSQFANKELAMERFVDLIQGALEESPKRKKTKIPIKAREKRIDEKKHRARFKKLRSKIISPDER